MFKLDTVSKNICSYTLLGFFLHHLKTNVINVCVL